MYFFSYSGREVREVHPEALSVRFWLSVMPLVPGWLSILLRFRPLWQPSEVPLATIWSVKIHVVVLVSLCLRIYISLSFDNLTVDVERWPALMGTFCFLGAHPEWRSSLEPQLARIRYLLLASVGTRTHMHKPVRFPTLKRKAGHELHKLMETHSATRDTRENT